MMNMIELQDKLKNFSQDQLVSMMQQPTGEAPQFMVLSEITRRQKMQKEAESQQAPTSSVAQEAVAAAGVPQGGIADMARTLAPQTNVAQNTGAMSAPPQGMPSAPQGIARMASGGVVKMAEAGKISESMRSDMRLLADASRKGMTIDEYWDTLTPAAKARYEYFDRLEDRGDKVSTFMDSLKGISGEISDAASQAGTAYTDAMGPYSMFGRDSLVQTPEPTVVTPPYDPTSVDRNPPLAQQVTPIDPNTYPAGKFGSPATVPLSPSELAAQEESRRRVEGYDRQFINDERNFPVPNEPIVFDVREGAPQTASQTASQTAPQIPQSRADQEQRDLYAYNQARAAMEANRKSNARGTEFDSISAMAANLDGTSATGTLAGAFGNAIDPRFIGPTDGLALLEEEARARDAAAQTATQTAREEIRKPDFSRVADQYTGDGGGSLPSWFTRAQESAANRENQGPSMWNDAGGYFANLFKPGGYSLTERLAMTTGYTPEGFDEEQLMKQSLTPVAMSEAGQKLASDAVATTKAENDATEAAKLLTENTPTGGGLNSGRYSDYQQQLIDMLDSRKDEAKSDKWMALAQAGMALMQGGTGSFGGDLGKAGQTGLAALQESNKSARQDRFSVLKTLADIDATNRGLQIQAQAASQKGTLNPKDYVTMYQATAEEAMDTMTKLAPMGTPTPGTADLYENARAAYEDSMVMIRKLLGIGGANNKLAGNYNVTK
jgi:hypothetical protein